MALVIQIISIKSTYIADTTYTYLDYLLSS